MCVLKKLHLAKKIASRNQSLPFFRHFNTKSLKSDNTALVILQQFCNQRDKWPAYVSGDGSCLYNAVALALTGTENCSKQLRYQVAIELGLHEEYYKRELSARNMTMFCGTFFDACKDASSNDRMSEIWHIMALCNVINRTIISIYPAVNGATDYANTIVNTEFHPRTRSRRKPITIMWTSMSYPVSGKMWTPNHFVPLLPLGTDQDISPESEPEDNRKQREY